MKIYDCFQFFNEIDLLEIRLELLYNEVDYFVISETTRTHSDLPKKMFFEENKHLFEKYMDKIIHIVTDYPDDILWFKKREEDSKYNIQYNKIGEIYHGDNEGDVRSWPTFCRDYLQREFIKLGLLDCDDNDIIMVSDLDEIPKPEVVRRIREEQLVNYCVMIDCFNYYINILSSTNSFGAYAVRYSETKDVALTHLRNKSRFFNRIYKGGWHLSYMGGPERVKTKIESYSHQEYNNDNVKSNIIRNMQINRDVLGRGNTTSVTNGNVEEIYWGSMKPVELSAHYPENFLKLVNEKFKYLIKE